VARALELAGVATTMTSWHPGRTRPTAPPRVTLTRLERGMTLGAPGDRDQQARVLDATLGLLGNRAPHPPTKLDERVAP